MGLDIDITKEAHRAYILLDRVKSLSKISTVSILGSHEGFSKQSIEIEDFEEVFRIIIECASETEDILSRFETLKEEEPVK